MQRIFKYFLGVMLAAALAAPLSAYAFGSFGGTLLSPPVPCFQMPGFFLLTIKPAGIFSPFYIIGPGSLIVSLIPPVHPGQQVLGLSDAVLACNGVPALRVTLIGAGL